MKKNTKYMAFDTKIFETKEACVKHEEEIIAKNTRYDRETILDVVAELEDHLKEATSNRYTAMGNELSSSGIILSDVSVRVHKEPNSIGKVRIHLLENPLKFKEDLFYYPSLKEQDIFFQLLKERDIKIMKLHDGMTDSRYIVSYDETIGKEKREEQ